MGNVQTLKLVVNECFGPTFQGEGLNIGVPVMFLRLAGCNLHCVWCDTAYTWRFSDTHPHNSNTVYDPKDETHPMTPGEVYRQLYAKARGGAVRHLVISGGEPMLQQKGLQPFIEMLKADGWYIEVETAGTIAPTDGLQVDLFTVSLKLAHSGNPLSKRQVPHAIRRFVELSDEGKAVFKFVVSDLGDFSEVDALVNAYGINPRFVYIMPEGISAEKVQETTVRIAEETISRNFNLTTRLQVLTYGNKRAV
jgi:7-cyano-7-deazaguanosine (preQ0) biosynthesis protein QueE